VLSALALPATLALSRSGDAESLGRGLLAILVFVGLYAIVQLPFDVLGGYVLPRRFGRSTSQLSPFLPGLARGVAWHAAAMALFGATLLLAARALGAVGVIASGLLLMVVLLLAQRLIAGVVGGIRFRTGKHGLVLAECDDDGFTGGVTGIWRPASSIVPLSWRRTLAFEDQDIAINRRGLVLHARSWGRGRLLAIAWNLLGFGALSLAIGSESLSTGAGVVSLSLSFTLWSFAGLLLLPTPSRWGVLEIDSLQATGGLPHRQFAKAVRSLDRLQDDEPTRPPVAEMIFHPIPSVSARVERFGTGAPPGAWNAARLSLYLSWACLGLLGRAVHCNCGRPGLWVFLPTD